jgi:hypothetical protein
MELLIGTAQGIFVTDANGRAKPGTGAEQRSVRHLRRVNGHLLAGTNDGVMRSSDGGFSWTPSGIAGGVRLGHHRRPRRPAYALRRHRARGALPQPRRRPVVDGDPHVPPGTGGRGMVPAAHGDRRPGAHGNRQPDRSRALARRRGSRRGLRDAGRRRELALRAAWRQPRHPRDGATSGEIQPRVRVDGVRAARQHAGADGSAHRRRLPLRGRWSYLGIRVAGDAAALHASALHRPASAVRGDGGFGAHGFLQPQGPGRRPGRGLSVRRYGRCVAVAG